MGRRARCWTAAFACLLGCGRIAYEQPAGGGGDAVIGAGSDDVLDGLVARFTFDRGLLTEDVAGRDAECPDTCPTLDPDGVRGSALSMTGGPAHLRVANDPAFDTATALTVSGWVRYRSIAGRTCIFTKPYMASSANSRAPCTDADGAPFFYSCAPCDSLLGAAPVAAGAWIHYAGTWDGSTKRFYVDGALVEEAVGPVELDATPLVIGGDVDGDSTAPVGYATDGLIDELSVYDRALSAVEVARIARPPP